MSFEERPQNSAEVDRLFMAEDRLIEAGKALRVPVRRAPVRIIERLSALPVSSLQSIESLVNMVTDSFHLCMEEGVDPWNDSDFFKLSMQGLGLGYPRDFLEMIAPDDVVEGYNLGNIQIYRNLKFMESSTYALLELLSYEWPTLYSRKREVTDKIMSEAERMYRSNAIIKCDVPKHIIAELLSGSPQTCEIEHRYLAPLYAGPNRLAGAIVVTRGRVLDTEVSIKREHIAYL